LAGTTFAITTGRSIVCIEGEREARSPTDLRLLEIVFPRASQFTFVPVGGKGNVIRVVSELRESLPADYYGIEIFGLVDRDRSGASVAGVVAWPVCQIENLLLQPDAIAEYAGSIDGTAGVTPAEVGAMLDKAAIALRPEEISLRVMEAIGARTIRIRGTSLEEVRAALVAQREELSLADDRVEEIVDAAATAVDSALADGSYRQIFQGKRLLRALYAELELASCAIGYEEFAYGLAEVVRSDDELKARLDTVFDAFS